PAGGRRACLRGPVVQVAQEEAPGRTPRWARPGSSPRLESGWGPVTLRPVGPAFAASSGRTLGTSAHIAERERVEARGDHHGDADIERCRHGTAMLTMVVSSRIVRIPTHRTTRATHGL